MTGVAQIADVEGVRPVDGRFRQHGRTAPDP